MRMAERIPAEPELQSAPLTQGRMLNGDSMLVVDALLEAQ
jgi:hypothetical protein